ERCASDGKKGWPASAGGCQIARKGTRTQDRSAGDCYAESGQLSKTDLWLTDPALLRSNRKHPTLPRSSHSRYVWEAKRCIPQTTHFHSDRRSSRRLAL